MSPKSNISTSNFFKEVFGSSFKDIKSIYFKTLFTIIPFWIFLIIISYSLITIERDLANKFIEYSFSFLRVLLSQFISIICLFKIKSLIQNDNTTSIYLEMSYNLFDITKIIIKKIIFITLGYVLFIIPGIYLSIRWFLVYPISVFEQSDDPFFDSEKFVKKNYLRILFSLALFWIMFLIFLFLIVTFNILVIRLVSPKLSFIISIYLIGLLMAPIHSILEYEIYKYIKTNYKAPYDDIDSRLLKTK